MAVDELIHEYKTPIPEIRVWKFFTFPSITENVRVPNCKSGAFFTSFETVRLGIGFAASHWQGGDLIEKLGQEIEAEDTITDRVINKKTGGWVKIRGGFCCFGRKEFAEHSTSFTVSGSRILLQITAREIFLKGLRSGYSYERNGFLLARKIVLPTKEELIAALSQVHKQRWTEFCRAYRNY